MVASSHVLPQTTVPVVLSSLQAIVDSGLAYDFLLDGSPFLAAPTSDDPYVRDLSEDRRDQFDNSTEAGEQSFGQWWLRSQSSFHGGAEQKFLDSDPQTADLSRIRFLSSRYAYPFTAGELTIAGQFTTSAVNRKRLDVVIWSSVYKLAQMSGSDHLVHFANLPGLTGATSVACGATGICQDMCTDGENVYVAVADKVWRIDSTATATHIANITFVGPVAMAFVKQRLVVCTGTKIYLVDPNPGAPATPAVHYTNPATGWRYTSVADGPNGIYLTGYSGTRSALSSMTLTEAAGTITVGAPVDQLPAPPGEQWYQVMFYTNSFFALAGSNGTRVGQFTPYGQPQHGGLLMEGIPTYSLTANGTLIIVGARDSLWWVDMSTQIDASPRFAHAMYADTLNPLDATDYAIDVATYHSGSRDLVYAVMGTSANLLYQAAYVPDTDATLTTSWARFSTVEPKKLHYIAVSGNFPTITGVNPLTVLVETVDGDTQSFTVPGGSPSYEFAVNLPAAESFRVVFTLRDDATGHAVSLRSYQLKALPEPQRFGEIVLPLNCYDTEESSDGREFGYSGFTKDRLLALEDAAIASRVIVVVDRLMDVSYRATIRRLQYRQVNRPEVMSRMGGLLTVVLRKV